MDELDQVLASWYLRGSNGSVNLFFRGKGTLVETNMKMSVSNLSGEDLDEFEYYEWEAEEDSFIVQWEGYPSFDSGCHVHSFKSMKGGMDYMRHKLGREFSPKEVTDMCRLLYRQEKCLGAFSSGEMYKEMEEA